MGVLAEVQPDLPLRRALVRRMNSSSVESCCDLLKSMTINKSPRQPIDCGDDDPCYKSEGNKQDAERIHANEFLRAKNGDGGNAQPQRPVLRRDKTDGSILRLHRVPFPRKSKPREQIKLAGIALHCGNAEVRAEVLLQG